MISFHDHGILLSPETIYDRSSNITSSFIRFPKFPFNEIYIGQDTINSDGHDDNVLINYDTSTIRVSLHSYFEYLLALGCISRLSVDMISVGTNTLFRVPSVPHNSDEMNRYPRFLETGDISKSLVRISALYFVRDGDYKIRYGSRITINDDWRSKIYFGKSLNFPNLHIDFDLNLSRINRLRAISSLKKGN